MISYILLIFPPTGYALADPPMPRFLVVAPGPCISPRMPSESVVLISDDASSCGGDVH